VQRRPGGTFADLVHLHPEGRSVRPLSAEFTPPIIKWTDPDKSPRRRTVTKTRPMRSSPGGQILADLLLTLSARIRYAA
jgi:hypothetical protein